MIGQEKEASKANVAAIHANMDLPLSFCVIYVSCTKNNMCYSSVKCYFHLDVNKTLKIIDNMQFFQSI